MKSFLILAFLIATLSVSAQTADMKFEKSIEQMAKTYELSGAQITSVKSILSEKMQELNTLNSEQISVDQQQLKMQAIEDKYEPRLLAIFNDKQKKTYQVQKAMRQNAMRKVVETK